VFVFGRFLLTFTPGVITPGGAASAKGIGMECPCGAEIRGMYFPDKQYIDEVSHLIHVDKTLILCPACSHPSLNRILS
jgi:hypothetical protein